MSQGRGPPLEQHAGQRGRDDLVDAQRFPAIAALVSAEVFDTADDPDDEFIFGLERVLDGVEALVRKQPLEE